MPITDFGKPLIGYADWSDRSSLSTTAATEDATLGLGNLQTQAPTEVCSLAVGGGIAITADRGASVAWNVVLLLFTNATGAATWRIRAADTVPNLTAAPIYDSGTVTFWMSPNFTTWLDRHGFLHVPTPVTSRYIRIDLADAANPDSYFRMGRLIVGSFPDLSHAQTVGRTFGVVGKSKIETGPTGAKIVTPIPAVPMQRFTIELLTYEEAMALYELFRLRADSEDVAVLLRPNDPNHRHQEFTYGLFELGAPPHTERWFDQYEVQFTVEGLR